ncbi:hypothetical protein NDI43_25545 [Microcoleus vaginatus GB2-A3]
MTVHGVNSQPSTVNSEPSTGIYYSDANGFDITYLGTGFPACSTRDEFYCGVGILPVPQQVHFIVGWASCPPREGLLRMVQHLSLNQE